MKFTVLAVAAALVLVAGSGALVAQGTRPTVQVYKDPSCGCCEKWVEHLKQAGFTTKTSEVPDINAVKDAQYVPQKARSCHTAVVNGVVLEGHVPAADVQRFLKERPAGMIGLAVPGMPIGSPGMEVGTRVQPYDVLAFDKEGRTMVFASHGK
jgi:hypothetical protein